MKYEVDCKHRRRLSRKSGASGIGVVLQGSDGKVLKEYCENIGLGTNNRAEYMALLKSLDLAEELGVTNLK